MLVLLALGGCLLEQALYDERLAALSDGDGDGFGAADDCDDADGTVFPGADEVAYDGVDDDCDGADLVDVDGDGHAAERAGGDDCDDASAAVYAGASDTPYDGIDQDCRDGDANDLDGDGDPALEAGGEDCDDGDAAIRGGAPETWADGFTDNDCDGELEPATLLYGSGAWTGTRANGQLGRRLSRLGDVTGDGRAEYLATAAYDDGAYPNGGAVFLVSGVTGGPLTGVPEVVAGGESWFLTGLDGGEDVDGDGLPDFLVAATGYASGTGATWLVSGRHLVGASTLRPDDVASLAVHGDAPGTYSGAAGAFLGDVRGDGSPLFAVSAPYADAGGYTAAGRVGLFETADHGMKTLADAEVVVEGYFEGAAIGNRLSLAGDVDGDGIDDYMISFSDGDLAAILPGGLASPDVVDDALFRLTGTGAGERAECMMVGDLDGDDIRELGCIEGMSTLNLYSLLRTDPLRTVNEVSAVVDYGAGASGDILVDLGDLDGDGLDETLIPLSSSPAAGSSVVVVQNGSAFAYGARLDLLDAPLQAVASLGGGFGERAVLAGDVDGDGFDDIALGGGGNDDGGADAGAVVAIPVPH